MPYNNSNYCTKVLCNLVIHSAKLLSLVNIKYTVVILIPKKYHNNGTGAHLYVVFYFLLLIILYTYIRTCVFSTHIGCVYLYMSCCKT